MWSDIPRIRIWNRIEKSSQNRIQMHPYDIHIKIEYECGYPYLHFKRIRIRIIRMFNHPEPSSSSASADRLEPWSPIESIRSSHVTWISLARASTAGHVQGLASPWQRTRTCRAPEPRTRTAGCRPAAANHRRPAAAWVITDWLLTTKIASNM